MGGQYFARLNLEIYRTLNQKWIVIKHFFVVTRYKLILDMITAIVQAAGTYVAGRSF